MRAEFRIVYEEDGYPRELVDASEWQRAVFDRSLTTEMDVTVYRAGQTARVYKAGEIEELRPFFEKLAQPATPKIDEASTARNQERLSTPVTPTHQRVPVRAASTADRSTPNFDRGARTKPDEVSFAATEPPLESTPYTGEPYDPDAIRRKGRNRALWTIGGIIALIVAVGRCSPSDTSNQPAENNSDTFDTNVAAEESPTAPEEVTAAELASSRLHYLVRDIVIRHRPSENSASIATMERGNAVQGVVVLGENGAQWLKITAGQYAGYFIPAGERLSDAPRSQLDTSAAGARLVHLPGDVYAQPDFNSAIVSQLTPGTTVQVLGSVPQGFFEVELDSGGVGYVTLTAFDEESAVTEDSLVEEPLQNDQTPSEVVPSTTPQAAGPSFDCQNARTNGERAVCSSPVLAALDRQMAAQYRRALATLPPQGQAQLRQTLNRFLAYRDRCSDNACITEAYLGRMREISDIVARRWQPPR